MLSVPVKQRTPAQTAPRFSPPLTKPVAQGARFCNWQSSSLSARGISFAVQAQPETTIASLQTRVVLQHLLVRLCHTTELRHLLAHGKGWPIRADWCILRALAMLRVAEAGVGAAGGECSATDR